MSAPATAQARAVTPERHERRLAEDAHAGGGLRHRVQRAVRAPRTPMPCAQRRMRDVDALGRVGRPGDAAMALASWLVVARRGAAGVVRGLVLRLVQRRLPGGRVLLPPPPPAGGA